MKLRALTENEHLLLSYIGIGLHLKYLYYSSVHNATTLLRCIVDGTVV
jgi:hypothetical protein